MTFQEEHAKWLESIYPNQPVYIPAAGLVEEAGELLHALLKREQAALWGEEERYKDVDWFAKITDAIGDCGIYTCSFCNAFKIDFEAMMRYTKDVHSSFVSESPLTAASRLVSLGVAVVETPSAHNLTRYVQHLRRLCHQLALNLDGCILVTWERVKARKR